MKYAIFLIVFTLASQHSSAGDRTPTAKTTAICPTILNLPDTLQACYNTALQLSPTLAGGGPVVIQHMQWSPSTGLTNPNSLTPVLTVGGSAQFYKLIILGVDIANLVVNGDFSNGNTGFTSSYVPGTGGPFGPVSGAGEYVIVSNTSLAHNLFTAFGDHTTGSGQMMVINGASAPNTPVWCQTITVLPNTLYDFSTWVATAYPQSPAILQFSINGTLLLSPFNALATAGLWQQFHAVWFSGSSTTATICIVNQNTAFNGNDFVLDDIEFREACLATDSVFILPVTMAVAIDTAISRSCHGDSVSFSFTSSGAPPAGFNWTFGDGSSSTQPNPKHVYANGGTYTVQLVASLNNCTDTASIQIHVQPVQAGASFTMSDDTVCLGQVVQFSSTATGMPPLSYYWNIGNLVTSTSQTASYSFPAPGTYQITHAVTQSAGCTDTARKTLVVTGPAVVNTAVVLCKDSSITLGGQVINTSGVYKDTLLTAAGCDSIVTLTVAFDEPPVVAFSVVTGVNMPTAFTNLSHNAVTYHWDFGDSSTSSESDPSHQYTTTGSYQVCLTGWSPGGCKAKTCKQVPAEVVIALDVPTAFSPNGDGQNDILYVRGGGIAQFSFRVYNRWGQAVFETSDLSKGWDGSFKGRPVDIESFAYILQATFIDGSTKEKIGNITVMR